MLGGGRAALLAAPALLLAWPYALVLQREGSALAWTPVFFFLWYAMGIAALGGTEWVIDREGFRYTPGPLPTGAASGAHLKSEVTALFPWYLKESVGKNAYRDHYYACVRLQDGRQVELRGPYFDWRSAENACAEIALLWGDGFAVGPRNRSKPGEVERREIWVTVAWIALFPLCLGWAYLMETR